VRCWNGSRFSTVITFRSCDGGTRLANEQIVHSDRIRTHRQQSLQFWSICPQELKPMSVITIRILSLGGTSASGESAVSTARHIESDSQLAMKQATVAGRPMIQVNWHVAQPLLQHVLAMGRCGWTGLSRERPREGRSEMTHGV
jgi:hypothetical protein